MSFDTEFGPSEPSQGNESNAGDSESYSQGEPSGSLFDPEVETALGNWFQRQIGPIVAPIRDAQTRAEVERGVGSFESNYQLSKSEMNDVLELALKFPPAVVQSTPLHQLLDHAYRLWASGSSTRTPAPSATEPEQDKDRFSAVNDKFRDADATFAEMLKSEGEGHQGWSESIDRQERRLRHGLTRWDVADERMARLYRESR